MTKTPTLTFSSIHHFLNATLNICRVEDLLSLNKVLADLLQKKKGFLVTTAHQENPNRTTMAISALVVNIMNQLR